ncbi:cilia-and flagella-associated protein 96 isoform X1 [Phalacrocorax carbo]|uniref:cilia-and flagella-associated protein 96 isoform X1 n=1 Tax=Phalacrocorax carbo TaxID=9209 RepID=UPI00311A5CBB
MPAEGKSDMERIGLFSEMGYVTIGDKYVSHYMRPFNEAASKNRQMLPGGTKTLSALQAGYFEPQFVRIFDGEAYANPVQLRRRYRLAESKKNLGKAFLPSNGDKLPGCMIMYFADQFMTYCQKLIFKLVFKKTVFVTSDRCGLGSYYGTIGGSYAYFSPQLKARERYIPPGKNFYTNPGKKGTGYGYANLTIGEQFPHEPDGYEVERINAKKAQEEHKRLVKGGPFKLNLYPQEYFDMNPYFNDKPLPPLKKPPPEKPIAPPFKPSSPAKKSGGMKGGTFDPYPSHSADPYVIKKSKAVTTNKERQIFHPPPGPKSRPVMSIINLNVIRSLNVKNYKTAQLTSY